MPDEKQKQRRLPKVNIGPRNAVSTFILTMKTMVKVVGKDGGLRRKGGRESLRGKTVSINWVRTASLSVKYAGVDIENRR